MSAIIHFINLYAQSGGAVTASAAKAGQDAFVRDWMAAAKSGGATRGRLGNKPPPTTPPAGPDANTRTGLWRRYSRVITPPFDCMTSSLRR